MKNRKFFAIILFFVFFSMVLPVSSEEKHQKIELKVYEQLEKSNETRVIIMLKEPSTEKEFLIKTQKTNEEINLEKQEAKEKIINEVDEENVKHVFDDYIAASISEEKLKYLDKNENIDKVIVDKPIKAFLQDSVPLVNASIIWPIQLTGINITGIDETICILDTGINFSHPDLIGKNKTCIINCITEDCVENCSIGDDYGHGTHVAGIAAASGSIKGVAIGVNLIGVKVLDSTGFGSSSDLDAGISWCISNSALYNISVISMSLGTEAPDLYSNYCDPSSTTTASRINNATSRNISVIAATGNDGNMTAIAWPACITNVTSVGGTDKSDGMYSFGNRNTITDLLAPGNNINSTALSGGYSTSSGTSMAAPHVAGAFALIREFYKLQSNRVLKPSEIQNTLNNTGKQIFDSSSNLNFSRIDVYSAIISLDSQAPNVSLISPSNGVAQFSQNATFRCAANDVLLSNLTLYVWNSSGVCNNTEIRQTNGTTTSQEFNLTNLYPDNYIWNCLVYDSKGNFSFASSNYSLTISSLLTNLSSPSNNSFTNQNQTFNCSAETSTTKQLKNITFYLWNSTQTLIFNLSQNISGTANFSIFQYNFTSEGDYSWNCLVYNNETESAFASSNYTLAYDITNPNITLQSPEDSAAYTSNSQEITFQYNISDVAIANCTLIINNAANLTNSSITNLSATQTFTQTFAPSSYTWQINCTDSASNKENSTSRSFTITQIADENGGGGGSGGGGGAKIYYPTSEQILKGYTKDLNKNDRINFSIDKESHILTVAYIGKNSVNLTLQSSIVKLVLNIGQSAKLNLTSPDYYDFLLKLNSIRYNKANLTIQRIYEGIPKKTTEKNITNITNTESQQTKQENDKIGNYLREFAFIAIVIVIVIILIYFIKTKNKHEKNK